MEKPVLRALRHGVALGTAILSMLLAQGIIQRGVLPNFIGTVPRSWLAYAMFQSREGIFLALFQFLWPLLFLVPTAVLAEARIFRGHAASDLVLGALAMCVFQATLTAVVSFALWPWPLDNLIRTFANGVASVAYWVTLRALAALSHLRELRTISDK